MQKDVKIGIAIGVLIIALVAIFWWARNQEEPSGVGPADSDVLAEADLPEPSTPTQAPSAPSGGETAIPWLDQADEGFSPTVNADGGPDAAPSTGTGVETASSEEPAARPEPRTHVVRQGDTMISLARRYYDDPDKWTLIRDANRDTVPNPDNLNVGVRLVIPRLGEEGGGGATATEESDVRRYTVKAGDTLGGIARKFYGSESDWKRIHEANKSRVPDPNNLKIGVVLVIPPAD